MLLTQDEVEKTIKELRNTMKGLGTDEEKLMKILGTKTPKQMSQIMIRYHNNYGRTLYQHISGEVHGSFGSVCKGVALPIIEFDVDLIRKACDKTFTANYTYLTEVLVGRTNHDIKDIKTHYEDKYKEKVEDTIKRKCYGDMERLYLTCLEANREETKEYTEEDIANDVETLYNATEARWNASEKIVTDILCHRQFQHLRNVFYAYQTKYNKPFTSVIESKFIGPIRKNFIILVKSSMNRYQYIAEEFNRAINTNSLQHTKLIRYTIRYRTPVILELIKELYNKCFDISFNDALNNTIFADERTKDIILLLLNEKKKKSEDDKNNTDNCKSRGINIDNLKSDDESDNDDQESEKVGVIDEIQIVRENGDIETIQIVQEEVTEDDNNNVKTKKEE
ncbi:Annexin [Anaeromyces robustus]|uniref:Annexin n=1 Tax=Anaeromyces robustus TaxID=1754192 RepID=A0A1Y1XFC0_9FUNG|nr:Annexin [Anaeromyces robustus]|eukprot:ORX84106.1 Annexin [Anaeromyces robustus]